MNKLWFFFNTAQLTASFPLIRHAKLPANVVMLQKAYEKVVFLEIIPEGFTDIV
jgi:hypothetical protein